MNIIHSRLLLVALVTVLALASGCKLLPTEGEAGCTECELAFEVHVKNNFQNDHVRLAIDGMVVFDERVTTNYVWSLAEIIKLKRPMGTHQVKVVVNGSEQGESTFELDRPLFIHVRYYSKPIPELSIPKGVLVEVSEQRPMYD